MDGRTRGPFESDFHVETGPSLRARRILSVPMTTGMGSQNETSDWVPIHDTPEKFSTGIADFDRLIGGGFPRGGMALFNVDASIGRSDRELILTPTLLNFLTQSNGILAVLPARESPHAFRSHLTHWASRRRFDTRVRVVSYVDEDSEAPYVVHLRGIGPTPTTAAEKRKNREHRERMVQAERAVRGARSRMFLELVAFEIMDLQFGSQTAARMFFHGIKRTRQVGNLCVGILRPGVGCADAIRGMADIEFDLHRDDIGVSIRGIRPAFPSHLVTPDLVAGPPHVSFLPRP